MSSLAATASVAEDHCRCGPECSLKAYLPPVRRTDATIFAGSPFGIGSVAEPSPSYKECSLVGLLPWQMNYVKPSFRIYDGCTDTAKRVSTAVPLKDGSFLQVYPEKRHFATLDDWRGSYPVAWETRRTLSYAERTVDVGHGPVLYNGKKEGVMAPLALEEEEDALDALDGGYGDDERRVNGYVADTWDEDEEEEEAAPTLAAVRRSADEMGFELVSKVQMAIIRDLLKTLA